MSIIGTRPPLISETNLYELHHRARLAIKPGITGMWQVSGRSDITDFEEVVRLDKEYIENWNIGLDIDKVYFGYDVCLNQLIRGENDLVHGVIDFPYTFVNKDHLERVLHDELGEVEKSGIYGEINTTTERPVRNIPQFEPISKATGEPILVHKQNIKNNLIEMYKAKYYLKVGGRQTRGNGAIEAISLGTVVLLSPSDIICGQVLPKEAWVFNAEDAIEKINYLNNNPEEYEKLLELERALVQQFVIDYPKFWLEKAVELKKKTGANKVYKYSNTKYFSDIVKRYKNKKKRIQIIGK